MLGVEGFPGIRAAQHAVLAVLSDLNFWVDATRGGKGGSRDCMAWIVFTN